MAIFNNATGGNDLRNGPLFEANQFIGFGIGSDTLTGGIRSDIFFMSADGVTDSINGGLGTDRVDYSNSGRALTIALDDGSKAGSVTARFVTGFQQGPNGFNTPVYETKTVATLASIEDAVGSMFGDSITGSGVGNTLDGGAGNDVLFGLAGNDTLIGGAGDDTLDGGNNDDVLIGGAGMDAIKGGNGVDTVSYADASIGMNIRLDVPLFSADPNSPILTGAAKQITADGLVNEDTLLGIENVVGSDFNDVIKSNDALNTIQGGDGDDVLLSWIDGQRDVMNGGEGSDTIDYSGFSQSNGLIINLGQGGANGSAFFGVTSPGGVTAITFEDTLISIENATGTYRGDNINGNSAANVLDGRDGNDFLFGGGGGDTLTGGSGNDTFTFTSISDAPMNANEKILDFERGIDRIDLSLIDANVNDAGNQLFVIVDEFTGVAGQLKAIPEYQSTGQTWLMDVNGDGAADGRIMVHTTDGLGTFLTATDFVL